MTVHLLIRSEVADYDDWKRVFDENDEFRREYGQLGYDVLCDSSDDTKLCILMEFEEEARAKEFTESEELKKGMKRGGVLGRPEMTFLTLKDETHVPQPMA